MAPPDPTAARKRDHLRYFREGGVEARGVTALFEEVSLLHHALPDLDFNTAGTRCSFLGMDFAAPLMISGMTGGAAEAAQINRDLAQTARDMGIPFGLGSQRAMLENPAAAATFEAARAVPGVTVFGNIGFAQLLEYRPERVVEAALACGAKALCVHFNAAQELIQPEGDRDFRGAPEAFARLAAAAPIPVIAKETGCGISGACGRELRRLGAAAIDTGGAGGALDTTWTGVEYLRRGDGSDGAFWDWGIPTAAAVLQNRDTGVPLIASGGIRTGLDVAKAIAIGATLAGLASPVIQAWYAGGQEAVRAFLEGILTELKTAMVLTGAGSLAELAAVPRVLGPRLQAWVHAGTPDSAPTGARTP